MMAGIGDARIRQRMEACQQGIVQLDTLRQKHVRLMEQLRTQYPEFTAPAVRSSDSPSDTLCKDSSIVEPPTSNSSLSVQNALQSCKNKPLNQPQRPSSGMFDPTTHQLHHQFGHQPPPPPHHRCESPISSACMSHRSSMSIDSGYTSISSVDPFITTPMSYSAYRKKASTLERHPETATVTPTATVAPNATLTTTIEPEVATVSPIQTTETSNNTNSAAQMVQSTIDSTMAPLRPGRYGRRGLAAKASETRPRSMFAHVPNSQASENDSDSFAGVSVAATARKLLDASSFSQITPPMTSRKFATLDKSPPKPPPRSVFPPTAPIIPQSRQLSASSSALHHPATTSTTSNRPPPQFAKLDSPVHLQNAKVYAPLNLQKQSPPSTRAVISKPLMPSATSAFTPTSKPGSTPPMKQRTPSASHTTTSRPFIVPILGSAASTRVNRISTRDIKPDLSVHSPLEARKLFYATPFTISRYGGTGVQNAKCPAFDPKPPTPSTPSRSRREKMWLESEGL
uniref:CUPID domain-containing protein n=1 Tax=Panagrellus redivivus TaxID=6233 RepID=A0A7E4V3J4_PANRE